tara:strand:- start:71 stop:319 length:249 start_codon:yes stop_codon:yes gene_type:complete
MQPVIYSNGSQECQRAQSLLNSIQFSECENARVFLLDKDFTINQFKAEFGDNAEFPQIAIGLHHRGTLKETMHYMSKSGMFV